MSTSESGALRAAFDYYLAHQAELVERFNGRVIVIADGHVWGDFADELSALASASKELELGTFLLQRVSPGAEGYTQSFRSRVTFVPA